MKAIYKNEECEILYIDWEHRTVLIKAKCNSTVYMNGKSGYTQKIVSFEAVKLLKEE